LETRILLFAIAAGLLSGANLFLHKVAASRLERTDLPGFFEGSYIASLARNPYV